MSNHFLEIQYDEQDFIWMMVHSGSRNMGLKICDRFDEIAEELNKKFYSGVSDKIHFLPLHTIEGESYLDYMNFALMFAFLNRRLMLEYIKKDITHLFNHLTVRFEDIINIHHNYANQENHFGHNVWVHRKGATAASENTIGIIPGSMGTKSYIVKGKGNIFSYQSCSHGAGRTKGRKDFNREYNTEEKIQEIHDSLKGIVYTRFSKETSRKKNKETGLLDVSEAPQAYKNIDEVMDNQKDLVEIITTLRPLISMKG